ncbi:uncharacterized protein [Triticum aestivum]|nr:uncharacterized protein LOC123094754 isoform X2 [Triticum aestivum]
MAPRPGAGHPAAPLMVKSPEPLLSLSASKPPQIPHLPLPRSLSSPCAKIVASPPLVTVVVVTTATVLPGAWEHVQEDRRHLLRPSQASNRAEPPRRLAIELIFTAYIAGRHRRLPRLRSIPGHLELISGTAVLAAAGRGRHAHPCVCAQEHQ